MNSFFVNLPLRYIDRDRHYLDYFLEHRLCPELGLDVVAMDSLSPDWHNAVAETLRSAGLACSIHLPFFDLQPGSLDNFILDATRRRLALARTIVRVYEPSHLIAHAGFSDIYMEFNKEWVSRSIETWSQFLADWPDHPPLFLENVYEEDPAPLLHLFEKFDASNAGICFDTGHWHCFSQGSILKNIRTWLQELRPYIRHLHLHDNEGSFDQHLGLGRGKIPWEEFFALLNEFQMRPSITLEPHTQVDIEHSLAFISAHKDWFQNL